MSDQFREPTKMILKKCPFCGGNAEFVRKPIKVNGVWCDAVYVWCMRCDARSNRVLFNANIHKNDSEYIEAAKLWNTRRQMENIVEQIKELYSCSTCDLPKRYECNKGECTVAELIEIIQKGCAE